MCGWGARVALDKGTSIYNSLERKREYTSRKLNIPQFGVREVIHLWREEVVKEERKGEGYLVGEKGVARNEIEEVNKARS